MTTEFTSKKSSFKILLGAGVVIFVGVVAAWMALQPSSTPVQLTQTAEPINPANPPVKEVDPNVATSSTEPRRGEVRNDPSNPLQVVRNAKSDEAVKQKLYASRPLKGARTLAEVVENTGVPLEYLLETLHLPKDLDGSTEIASLRAQHMVTRKEIIIAVSNYPRTTTP